MTDLGSTIANWRLATLADLFEIKDRDRIPVNADERATRQGTVPYYGATGQVGWIDDFIFDEELILLGEDGAPFLQGGKPKAYVIRGKTWVNNHAHVLRALGSSPSAFWKYQLDQVDYHGFVSGTTRLKLPQGSMRQIRLLVPPLAEQHRIVEAIDSYFTRLDDAVASLERVQRNLKRYRASVLKAAVEGRLVPTEAELARSEGRDYEPASVLLERILAERRRSWEEAELARIKAKGRVPKDDKWRAKYEEPTAPDVTALPELPEGWCWASIDQLGEVSGGVTQNAKRAEFPMQVPFLRVANVYANELRLDDVKAIGVSAPELLRTRLASGDLLIVEGNGSIDQIGRVALWDGSIDPCLHQNHLIKVRFVPLEIAKWSLCWLLAPLGRIAIERAASSTSGLHTLSLSKVAQLPVPVAPLAEQIRITAEVDRLFTLCIAVASDLPRNVHRCSRLRQSILTLAFEGRLVDQDPADEPASVLLERIKAEREAKPTRSSRPQHSASRTSKVRK